jgi:hypothetical protein
MNVDWLIAGSANTGPRSASVRENANKENHQFNNDSLQAKPLRDSFPPPRSGFVQHLTGCTRSST